MSLWAYALLLLTDSPASALVSRFSSLSFSARRLRASVALPRIAFSATKAAIETDSTVKEGPEGELMPDSPTSLEVADLVMQGLPPPRNISSPGYKAPPDLVTWKHFTYTSPKERRAAVRDYIARRRDEYFPKVPTLKILLIGGVASGKGTLAPMISQAYKCRVLGVGQLLRGQARAGLPRGVLAYRKMVEGELLDDELVLELLNERLDRQAAVERGGWLLDGFPRTKTQAEALLSPEWEALRPDAVILIERPDELVKEFTFGRCSDSTTGQTYHPVYAPAPPEVHDRLVWRLDDTAEVLGKRIAEHKSSCEDIVRTFQTAGVPFQRLDNARCELETFNDAAAFLEEVAIAKVAAVAEQLLKEKKALEAMGKWGFGRWKAGRSKDEVLPFVPAAVETLAGGANDSRDEDVGIFCEPSESSEECVIRFKEDVLKEEKIEGLLAAVRRCNTYDPADYLPVYVGDDQVGWVNDATLDALAPQLAKGVTCELAELEKEDAEKGGKVGRGEDTITVVRLAPEAHTPEARTEVLAELVAELVSDEYIPAAKVRKELQDVHPLSRGFVAEGSGIPPAVRVERAAMIYLGAPSYGVHVNGYVRDPARPDDPRPWAMWVAKRSASKATYAGLLDQFVAGGQPSGITFAENVRKECEEEASLPPDIIARIRQTGLISYKYTTRKGLSTKILATYDLELPPKLSPICADGEVEEFRLIPIPNVLRSIRDELPLWKPNSAMVVVDFAIRHGFITFEEPGYMEIAHLLRTGGSFSKE